MSSPPTFQLFTSIRYDPLLLTSEENSRPDLNFITPSPFYMLAYHRDRMVEAAQHFDFDLVTSKLADGLALHESLSQLVASWLKKESKPDGPLKLRILFDKTANMTVDFLPIPAVPMTTLYPKSLDPPNQTPQTHPAKNNTFTPSPLTGGAMNLGSTDSLPAGDSSQHPQPPQPKEFTPSPLTGGALNLGPTDSLPAGDSSQHPQGNNDTLPIPPPPQWTLRLDTSPTAPSPHTLLKTTARAVYDESRARALPTSGPSPVHREVVLWNSVREVTEGTLTSLYFWRGGRWVTPPVGVPSAFLASPPEDTPRESDSDEGELRHPFPGRWGHSLRSAKVGAGGQRGTSRRWALGKGFCMEETVEVATVGVGEGVWVSNGVRGFGFGRVVG